MILYRIKSTFSFFAALSSIKSNIDNSNCILVQDVKAVTHAQGIRDALSTSSPSDGMFLCCHHFPNMSCYTFFIAIFTDSNVIFQNLYQLRL